MKNRFRLSFITTTFILILVQAAFSHNKAQEPASKPRAAEKQTEAFEAVPAPSASEAALKLTLQNLSNQLAILSSELRALRRETERSSATLELLLYEERLAKVEDKLDSVKYQKAQLEAREQDLVRRMRNIPQEIALRGTIRKDEAEAALRAEYQRGIDDTRTQLSAAQDRIIELQANADRLRRRIEALRKRLEPDAEKEEK
jgi:hypothetical protein